MVVKGFACVKRFIRTVRRFPRPDHTIAFPWHMSTSTNYSLFLVIMGAKWGIFEPQDPHKIRDFWERASSTHHKIHHHSPYSHTIYSIRPDILYSQNIFILLHFISPFHPHLSTQPHPNSIPETNKIRIHWLSPSLILIFIHIISPNISLFKIMIPTHLSTLPIAPSFPLYI